MMEIPKAHVLRGSNTYVYVGICRYMYLSLCLEKAEIPTIPKMCGIEPRELLNRRNRSIAAQKYKISNIFKQLWNPLSVKVSCTCT